MRGPAAPFLMTLLLGGCAVSPSINVLGAYFPDWMFCVVGAMGVATLVHFVMRALRGPSRTVSPLPVTYFAVTAVVALAAWLAFFAN